MTHLAAGSFSGELLRVLLVAAALLGVLVAAERWQRRWSPPVEWTRKFVHVATGLGAACFPWIFGSAWSVVALGALFCGVITVTRRRRLLTGLHCVERRSEGDFYYIAAITGLFLIGRNEPLFYVISLLVVVTADSLAALWGSAYGRWKYVVGTDRLSVEGSALFFVAAFASVLLPLLWASGLTPAASLLVSFQVALLAACLEAISRRGSDNLVVPLATFALLAALTRCPLSWLAWQAAAQSVLAVMTIAVAWCFRPVAARDAIGAHLLVCGAWALGGPLLAVPPALALLGLAARKARRAG